MAERGIEAGKTYQGGDVGARRKVVDVGGGLVAFQPIRKDGELGPEEIVQTKSFVQWARHKVGSRGRLSLLKKPGRGWARIPRVGDEEVRS